MAVAVDDVSNVVQICSYRGKLGLPLWQVEVDKQLVRPLGDKSAVTRPVLSITYNLQRFIGSADIGFDLGIAFYIL
jgi:hypothetical protein